MKESEHVLKQEDDSVIVTIDSVCLEVQSIRRGRQVVICYVVPAREIGKPAG